MSAGGKRCTRGRDVVHQPEVARRQREGGTGESDAGRIVDALRTGATDLARAVFADEAWRNLRPWTFTGDETGEHRGIIETASALARGGGGHGSKPAGTGGTPRPHHPLGGDLGEGKPRGELETADHLLRDALVRRGADHLEAAREDRADGRKASELSIAARTERAHRIAWASAERAEGRGDEAGEVAKQGTDRRGSRVTRG